jgi:hypothetical protein
LVGELEVNAGDFRISGLIYIVLFEIILGLKNEFQEFGFEECFL